jgi:NAD(P)-dependent dehydrogenase (short-subunit alcohol dehydrogenase family)/uncharacterized protein YndB with AHSA1/START domain
MARNRIHIEASPQRVFAVLSDPECYPGWVVGAADTIEFEDEFPAPGSSFRHRVGLGPFTLTDRTSVVDVDPPRRIELKAKARPLGTADIVIELSERAGGTELLMEETPGDRLSALVATNPVAEAALRIRNSIALARLKRIAEDRPTGMPRRTREIAGQRVLITGGSSGIGLASAEKLAAEGARLVLLARNELGLAEARRRVRDLGAEAHVVRADIADRDSIEDGVAAAAERLGGLDVVVCGAAAVAFGPFAETDPEDFDATVRTVLLGTANTIRAALPPLEASRGALVVTGSTASRMPVPSLAAYAAAKHGLRGLVESLRIELAEAHSPVTISLLNPGPVDTPLWSHLQSSTGLLPPPPTDIYGAEAIAEALVGMIRRPRDEVTVGGFARLQVALHDNLRGPTEKALLVLHRLAQSGDARVAEETDVGALRQGHGEGRVEGGFGGRASAAVKVLGAWDGLLRRIPGAG